MDIQSQRIYWQYAIRPADGTVTRINEQRLSSGEQQAIPQSAGPAGAITACRDHPFAESPDRRFIATCVEVITKKAEHSVDYSYSFIITDVATGVEMVHWTPTKSRDSFQGFAWSPDSKNVATLNLDEYYGKGPLEILSAMSGHPVPHNTVYLEVFEVDGWKRTEYMIRNEVKYAFTRILSWQ